MVPPLMLMAEEPLALSPSKPPLMLPLLMLTVEERLAYSPS